jgi:hypothetical protein
MGKSIGLGQVRIDPVGLFLVDRLARYKGTDLFNATRYHHVWTRPDEKLDKWPDTYRRERREAAIGKLKEGNFELEVFRSSFRDTMNLEISHALELLGDPSKVAAHPVHTPQVAGVDLEEKTYQWFVNNQNRDYRQQRLEPLGADSQVIALKDTWEAASPRRTV